MAKPPGKARRLSPRSPAAAARSHTRKEWGRRRGGISNKGGGRTFFDGWLLGVVLSRLRCAAHRGGRRQRRRTRTTAAASSLPGASPFSLYRHPTGRRQNYIRLQPPKEHTTRNGALAATRAARLGSGGKQASKQTGAGRRRASQARGKGRGGTLAGPVSFSTCLTRGLRRRRGGIAGGFFLSRRKGVHTRDLTPRYRRNVAEGRRTAGGSAVARGRPQKGAALGNHSERQERGGRLCEGQDHSRHWRGWHGDWLPRRPPVGIVARARDLCCARFGGREIREGTDARAYQSTGRRPNPQKTPHTPGPNTTANRGPSCATPRERTPSARPTTHAPVKPHFLAGGAGSNGPPTANPAAPPLAPARHARRPAPAPRGTRARLAAFQPSPARSAGSAGGRRAQAARSGARPNQKRPPHRRARPRRRARARPPAAAEGGPPARALSPHDRGQGRSAPGPGKAAPPTARQPGPPKACPAFGDGSRRGRASSRRRGPRPARRRRLPPRPRGRRGRGPTSRGPRTARARPPPGPDGELDAGLAARPQPKVAPPIVVGAGPQPPRPRPGPPSAARQGKTALRGQSRQGRAPLHRCPRPARAQGPKGKAQPAPRGRRGRLTGRSSHRPAGTKGKGSPSRQTGAGGPCTAGAGGQAGPDGGRSSRLEGGSPPPPAAEAVPLSRQALSHHDRAQGPPLPVRPGQGPVGGAAGPRPNPTPPPSAREGARGRWG
ncbi:hypothetical protein C7M84_010913, partial [Penaeus vannamei]